MYYNDYYFYYGYYIFVVVMIGYFDLQWMRQNKDYVNVFVCDIVNLSMKDKYFFLWRNFDWYYGYSWVYGFYVVMDGKVRWVV